METAWIDQGKNKTWPNSLPSRIKSVFLKEGRRLDIIYFKFRNAFGSFLTAFFCPTLDVIVWMSHLLGNSNNWLDSQSQRVVNGRHSTTHQ